MQSDYEVLLSISLAGHGQFVTMLIKLESHGIFSLNFAHVYILRLSSAYQIKVNNKRNQGKCRSKQSDLTEFLWRLIWFCTVCQWPIQRTIGLYALG